MLGWRTSVPAPHRCSQLAGALIDVAVLIAATVVIGSYCHAFTGFPKGYDAWGHLAKVRMLVDGFPSIHWNDEWYAGQPAFLGSYPPGYHLLLAGTSGGTGWSLPDTMVFYAAVALAATVVGCYLLVLGTTASRVAALTSAALVLGSPTLWDQVVELGLYPRFTAFAFGALAAGCAALHRQSPSRPRAVLTLVVLASALATHPVSGLISCGVVGLVLLCAPTPTPVACARRAAGVVGTAVALCGFFYVPLLLVPRSQSALTDVEVPLRVAALTWPAEGDLAALPPFMLAGAAVVLVAVVWTWVEPRWHARRASSLALTGRFRPEHGGNAASAAMLGTRVDLWSRGTRDAPDVLVVAGLTAAALIAIGYGLIGYVLDRFPYYINGLQPRDLLVYPAWLLSAALGVGLHVVVRHRSAAVRVATAVASAVLVAGCVVSTALSLPPAVRDSDDAPTRAMMTLMPPEALGNDDYRIGGLSDGTSRWINAVTDTRQIRGYDDHGNLHLDWQYWLEGALAAAPSPTASRQRRFLLDYYAVRWLLTDTAKAHASLVADPALPAVGRVRVFTDVTAWEYRDAHPVTTAITAPTVLVVGDDAHYDMLLRVLALDDVGADRLLPVHGPATLSEVTAQDLRGHPVVLVYGAEPGPEPASATFAAYAASGGHIVADVADSRDPDSVAAVVGAPVTSTQTLPLSGRWMFTGSDAALGAAWSPPVFDGSFPWNVRAPEGPVTGQILLASAGTPVLVRATVGDGSVTWSSVNLPYHASVFSDVDEVAYLSRMLGALDVPAPVVRLTQDRPDPQHRTVVLPPGTDQVLIREYRSPDWHARVDGRRVPLLAAGPDMMFVRVPAHGAPVTVTLEYRMGLGEMIGIMVSLLAVIATVGYALNLRMMEILRTVWTAGAAAAGRVLPLRRRSG